MKYKFLINDNPVSLNEFLISIHDEIDGDDAWIEAIETGSVTCESNLYQIIKID